MKYTSGDCNGTGIKYTYSDFNGIVACAVILLLVSLFLPFFDVWGGLFPTEHAPTFLDALEEVQEDIDRSFKYYHVHAALRMSAFLPSIFLLITALVKSKGGCIVFSVAGLGLLLFHLHRFVSEHDWEELLDFDDCSICFGFWIALFVFIVSFFKSITAEN